MDNVKKLGLQGWSMDQVHRGGPWTGSKEVVHGPRVHVLYMSIRLSVRQIERIGRIDKLAWVIVINAMQFLDGEHNM